MLLILYMNIQLFILKKKLKIFKVMFMFWPLILASFFFVCNICLMLLTKVKIMSWQKNYFIQKKKKNTSIADLKAFQTSLLFSIYVLLLLVNNKCFLTKSQLEVSITKQWPCTRCKIAWNFVSSCTKNIHTLSAWNLFYFRLRMTTVRKE